MANLILIRHGQSVWNLENIFTGWTNVSLSENGKLEAKNAARILLKNKISFDFIFVSVLNRAIDTLNIVLEETDLKWVNQLRLWRLNERHYGALQGQNKADVERKFGSEQVRLWRRSFDEPVPLLLSTDARNPANEPMYASLDPSCLPLGESLKQCAARVMPVWFDMIVPRLKFSQNLLVVAHGNSLRALIKHIDCISDSEIVNLEIPTGVPILYEFDKGLRHSSRRILT